MTAPSPELARVKQLLEKLEHRARSCRGLYPVQGELEFLNLSSCHQFRRFLSPDELPSLNPPLLNELSLGLERFWRDPTLCQQVLAQCLLRHVPVSLKTYQPGNSAREAWLAVIREQLASTSETACQDRQLKSA